MTFWTTSTGESATKDVKAEGTYETGGNSDPLPDNSSVEAFIEKAEWKRGRDEDGNPEYVNLQWRVIAPESVKNRVVFQKLWLTDANPNAKDPTAKRDKDLAMFAKIDAIAGGKLAQLSGKPTNDNLALALTTKVAVLKVGVWEMGDSTGNWIKALAPKGGFELSVPEGAGSGGGGNINMDNSDIPF